MTYNFFDRPVYPQIDNDDYTNKIYLKSEFHLNRSHGISKVTDVVAYQQKMCAGKTLSNQPHQTFISNYVNFISPYRGLVLVHETGTGKTRSVISTANIFAKRALRDNSKIVIVVPRKLLKDEWVNQIIRHSNDMFKTPDDVYRVFDIVTNVTFRTRVLGKDVKIDNVRYTDNSANRLISLDNSLLIIDEAHNITGNDDAEAVKKLVDNSSNLKLLLLTATPMKNIASDVLELFMCLLPKEKRYPTSKVFKSLGNQNLEFTENGRALLNELFKGRVSYIRSNNPYTFPRKNIHGELYGGLVFTKVVYCELSSFHVTQELNESSDILQIYSEAQSNFAYPSIEDGALIPRYSKGDTGIRHTLNVLQTNAEALITKICELLKIPYTHDIIDVYNSDMITGELFNIKHLPMFSSKYATCLTNINKNAGTHLVYSNFVTVGVNTFKQVLLRNGYNEYPNQHITKHTQCALCPLKYEEHTAEHAFMPAMFMVIGGQDDITHEYNILRDVFNNKDNINGSLIKCVIGSKVINEGVDFRNISNLHILEPSWTLARDVQTIGRAVRYCSHYSLTLMGVDPSVNIYRYASLQDINMYTQAEKKFILTKEVTYMLKTNAVDCALTYGLNKHGSNAKCIPLDSNTDLSKVDKSKICPVECDFKECKYLCANNAYYDEVKDIYKTIDFDKLDQSTFNINHIYNEYVFAKQLIKELYAKRNVYTIDDIINKYKKSIDNQYSYHVIYRAILSYTKISDGSDITKDYLYNRYNQPGYLVYTKDKFVFEIHDISDQYTVITSKTIAKSDGTGKYLTRPVDYTYNKEISARKSGKYLGVLASKIIDDITRDILKIKILDNSVSSSEYGMVCYNSFTLDRLTSIFKYFKYTPGKGTRIHNCYALTKHLLIKEHDASVDDIQYIMVPVNHVLLPFPLNVNERIQYLLRNGKGKVNKKDMYIYEYSGVNDDDILMTKSITRDNRIYLWNIHKEVITPEQW